MSERSPLFSEKIGWKEYTILSENREVMEAWKVQIQQILDLLESENFNLADFDHIMQRAGKGFDPKLKHLFKRMGGWEKIVEVNYEYLKAHLATLDEEAKKMIAINLWTMRERAQWSTSRAVLSVARGDKKELSSVIDGQGYTNCLDTSVLGQAMAKEFGLDLEIVIAPKDQKGNYAIQSGYTNEKDKYQHRALRSSSGYVADSWWGAGRAGFFKDEQDFYQNNDNFQGESHSCSGTSGPL